MHASVCADVKEIKQKLARSNAPDTQTHGNKDYVPKKVWIKGFIFDWKKKHETSLSKPKVVEWLESVLPEMDAGIRAHVDVEETKKFANRMMHTKFALCLKNVTDREIAWSVKADIERIWGQDKCLINGACPRAVVQPSPQMEPYINAGGKFLGALREKGVPKDAVSPEWGPPVKMYDNRAPQKPVQLAVHDVHKGWDIDEAALHGLCAELSASDLKASLQK